MASAICFMVARVSRWTASKSTSLCLSNSAFSVGSFSSPASMSCAAPSQISSRRVPCSVRFQPGWLSSWSSANSHRLRSADSVSISGTSTRTWACA